ncbi:hypothetical protein SLEP1_g28178 [Rubroshorea leprosula]|uniref:Uncharacterized protein n=1 Tax=Rubroshorea leprosula TaxID=152421 RepID=A0AAV5K596_9ROSI|nr:hypothetical protein SLEP1_g28178 [Rubroshorea leprosula]
MEDMRDSTAVPQIVKIVRLVVKFHPLLTVTNLIFGVIFLYDWIEEEVSNQWKILKVYCQSTIRAVLDLIIKKMKNLSRALQMHLNNEVAKGQLKAKVIGKLALFFATFLLLDTEFCSKYDKEGTKTQLLLLFGMGLLTNSKPWSQLGILHGRCVCVANSTSNFTFFILAIVFAKFYDDSLRTISVLLFIAVFVLCLLVVLRPRTDLGLFSFIIGVIGSITYNRFEFTFTTWIIASICFILFSFKSWLDKYWLDLQQDPSINTTVESTGISMILILVGLHVAQSFIICSAIKSSLSNYKVWLVNVIVSMIWSLRIRKFYGEDNSLPSTNTKGTIGLIFIVVNVVQGMLSLIVTVYLIADYKYWFIAVISYVIFHFWLCIFWPKNLSSHHTNTEGISGMILFWRAMIARDIELMSGLEPYLYLRESLVGVIFWILLLVRLHIVIS